VAIGAHSADNEMVTREGIEVIEAELDAIVDVVERLRWSLLRRTNGDTVAQLREARRLIEEARERCCGDEPVEPGDPALQRPLRFLEKRLAGVEGARVLLLYSGTGGLRAIAIVDDEKARGQVLDEYDSFLDRFQEANIDLVVHLTSDFKVPLDRVAAGASRKIDL